MFFLHQSVDFHLRILCLSQLPKSCLHMLLHFLSFLLNQYLCLQQLWIIMQKRPFECLPLCFHRIQLFLFSLRCLLFKMVSLSVVSYLILKLCNIIPSTNHPGSWLLLRKCLSLAPLLHSDLVEFALLYLTNECQLFNECKDLLSEPFRLILWQQRIELLLSHRQIAHLLFLILQFLVLRLHL